jgi:hypothetical protein
MDSRKNGKSYVVAIVCMALFLWSGLAYAQQVADDNSIHSSAASAVPSIVSLNVNTSICTEWPEQCSGFEQDKARPVNHNPIRVEVQVLSSTGSPVNNLNSSNFLFSCPFMPPSAQNLIRLECANCFLAGGDGLYAFFLYPDQANGLALWKKGKYVMQVQVNSKKVVRVFAPFALE